METLIIYLIGWLILSIGYFVYKVAIDNDHKVTKKLHAWHAFWSGFFSWIGIFFVIIFLFVGSVFAINDWVEEKLNK